MFHFTGSEDQVIEQEAGIVLKMCLFFGPQACPVIHSVLVTNDIFFSSPQHHRCACVLLCVDRCPKDYCDALTIFLCSSLLFADRCKHQGENVSCFFFPQFPVFLLQQQQRIGWAVFTEAPQILWG